MFSTLLLKQREATAKTSCALSGLIASQPGPFTGGQFIQERLIESGNIVLPDKVKYITGTGSH
jgi:hypothetical protein